MNVNKKYQIEKRRELRKKETKFESILWNKLRNRKFMNLKFRRQYGIGEYVVDFYCPKLKLAIEVDGEIHDIKEVLEYDKIREVFINGLGIKIIRFKNNEIAEELENVLKTLEDEVDLTL